MVGDADRDVFFEFIAIGASVKVTAIDSQTGIEVSIVGPASAAQADLERLALQKLKARLAREASAR
ncbi:MAG TPA: serine hydroxymethyltransferase [Xanthobacteraceae bacterium]|nr:serine hydroxymethyltransferase [Xanthobacteraceae bacterium]